jgi:hypothetical protein
MDVERKTKDGASVKLSADELALLNNALNEVCNGVDFDDDEFQTRLGADRAHARKLLAELGHLVTKPEKH